ncbi:hypothetical protein [Micromonospora tarensis]|uniref:DUF4760 domain-containing protein n=1 Tax=Micromonospora tarensis TaxID=2806100 RepID=A0ABS1YJB5_9ACTN|nr:hypothetical protein [Micromonospora tarensis]MBM0277511.1 hypothetical protein [Micromonospora tarensis]
MAQWWELAIPAGGTLAAAISAGWITSSYQKRNGERLLRIQASENEKARQDQLSRDREFREAEHGRERENRTHDIRRDTYIEFWRSSKLLASKRTDIEKLKQLINDIPDKEEHAQKRETVAARLQEAKEAANKASERQIEALTHIIFLGSVGIQQASQCWIEARDRGADEVELRAFEAAFVASANYELSDPNPIMNLREFHFKLLKRYLSQAGRTVPSWVEGNDPLPLTPPNPE